jgi:hypothetical protein
VRCRHLAFQDPAPDRLSVIRPPAAVRLTAHLPASVRSTAAWTLARPSGELRRFFGSPDALSIRPSDTSFSSLPSARSPRGEVGPLSGRLILARRGHVNARQQIRDRGAFHRTGPIRALLRDPFSARCSSWPAGAASARFHRCAKTPVRLLLAPLSRDESRPRAPLRLLQVVVSTSTTLDHSSISIHGNAWSGRPPGLDREFPSCRGSRRRYTGSGVGPTDARHSRSRLLAPETSPQPRSLRAPGVARRLPSPVWSDAVRRGAADVERPCKERPPKGWYGAGPPRRGPALTNPRCLPSRRRSRANGHLPASRS